MPPQVDIRSCKEALWIPDRPFVSLWTVAYTLIVADAEHYIKRAVERYAPLIPDELTGDVKKLFRQEMAHARLHAAVSANLADAGYGFPTLMGLYRWLTFELLEKNIPNILNLGIAAGVEHYNSTLAIQSLEDQSWYQSDGGIGDLLYWHYEEEIDHRTVVFDVLQQMNPPSWVVKLSGFVGFNLSWIDCWIFALALAQRDRMLFSRVFWRDAQRYFWGKRRLRRGWQYLLEYASNRFHPSQLIKAEVL